ncbi:hypothetical protein C0Q70_20710 [Pomacea canaliculata]|uniref:Uncharacterized protein n=1 Tax=Pomacea canaliculata TaxID=400727 RepID=A0A2T7NGA7_POMCA|nr:hypothetical protein C0Q70_20710 [Pomacea canaliculata]
MLSVEVKTVTILRRVRGHAATSAGHAAMFTEVPRVPTREDQTEASLHNTSSQVKFRRRGCRCRCDDGRDSDTYCQHQARPKHCTPGTTPPLAHPTLVFSGAQLAPPDTTRHRGSQTPTWVPGDRVSPLAKDETLGVMVTPPCTAPSPRQLRLTREDKPK